MSSKLLQRIARKSLHKLIVDPKDTVKFFKHGMDLGWSGFTPVGYPKAVPTAIADYVEENNLQGKMRFNLYVGASVGADTEDRWAQLNMIAKRWPYITGKNIADRINRGELDMGDIHLSIFAQDLGFGFFTKDKGGKLDIGVIEATEILPNGGIILAGSVGCAPEIVEKAEKLIIEINTSLPSFRGMHDITEDAVPPYRKPYLISRCDDRIGTEYVPCDPDKIIAIVESQYPDKGRALDDPDETAIKIADHILEFFDIEVKAGRLPKNLLPLQSGVGNIANAVTAGLVKGPFTNCQVWTEVLQDTMLDFFDSGKLDFASSTSLSLSEKGTKRFFDNFETYKKKIVLRPQQISNHPEMIRRLGVIAMNTPIEVDIYGHANSTLVGGTRMIHGIGGSGDFLRNAYLPMLHTPSVRPTKTDPTGISCIVPMCSHIDHTEHDISVVVTEQGLADLRGLAPRQRALEIIKKCAHPDYRDQLLEYYNLALKQCIARKAGHEPQLLELAHKMHINLQQNGTMKLKW
jgi:acetyl-CoA hydrolase